jgi:MoxR-like ATPase
MPQPLPKSIDDTATLLANADYVAERSLATAVFLALRMKKPLFLEGEAGVGKTEIAKVLSGTLGRKLVRLQCYEGLDIASAVYEWNYPRQMIEIRLAEAEGVKSREGLEEDIFTEKFLIRRPILQALEGDLAGAPVLLIDELDRTDEPFEAYLLEVLADFQVTIPRSASIKAEEPPIVVITSNRTREIHDAVKRRCLYHWVDYPNAARELEILRRKAPGASEKLSREVVGFVQRLRKMDLFKLPGVAETIDWSQALVALDTLALDPETINNTLGALLKYQDDIARVQGTEAAHPVRKCEGGESRRPSRVRELAHLVARKLDLLARVEDLLPGGRIHRNPGDEPLLAPRALGIARDQHALDAGGRRRGLLPRDERFGLLGEVLRGAERLGIDQDREHPVHHAHLSLVGHMLRPATGQRAAEQLAREREAGALVLAERHDRAEGRDHAVARVGRRVALVVDDDSGVERLSLVVRDAGLALRDAAGGEVEQERLAVRARDADAHRVGAEPRITAAPWRDDRPRNHVDEVQRHEPRLEALLGPVADAAEVVRVAERDDAGAVLGCTLDAERHRLAPDHLPVARAAVEP